MINKERFIKGANFYFNMTEARELTALVVDDEIPILDLLSRILDKNGIKNVDTVKTTQKGLDLLEDRVYNLVFTDLNQTPSGIDVYNAATARGSTVYIITGFALDMEEVAARVAKGHFLEKPFRINDVDKLIKDYIAQQNPLSQS